ncbi:Signal peptidase complex subunit 2 [Phytophthora cactorum]|nr:Signal peptidase complex subunit 2 [Phytophthora cactorum]
MKGISRKSATSPPSTASMGNSSSTAAPERKDSEEEMVLNGADRKIFVVVSRFFFIHALLFGYTTFIEKDILLRMTRSGSNPGKTVLVRTTFPYTDSHYTISIHHADAKGKQRKEELYVGRYFDKDGYFSKEAFTKDIETVLSRFENKDKKQ